MDNRFTLRCGAAFCVRTWPPAVNSRALAGFALTVSLPAHHGFVTGIPGQLGSWSIRVRNARAQSYSKKR